MPRSVFVNITGTVVGVKVRAPVVVSKTIRSRCMPSTEISRPARKSAMTCSLTDFISIEPKYGRPGRGPTCPAQRSGGSQTSEPRPEPAIDPVCDEPDADDGDEHLAEGQSGDRIERAVEPGGLLRV